MAEDPRTQSWPANNGMDAKDPYGKIRYIPASKGQYGVVYFCHSNLFPQGGMNAARGSDVVDGASVN